jgi:hypothetical protein
LRGLAGTAHALLAELALLARGRGRGRAERPEAEDHARERERGAGEEECERGEADDDGERRDLGGDRVREHGVQDVQDRRRQVHQAHIQRARASAEAELSAGPRAPTLPFLELEKHTHPQVL